MTIRPATTDGYDAIWAIFHEVVASADTYVYALDTPPDVVLSTCLYYHPDDLVMRDLSEVNRFRLR